MNDINSAGRFFRKTPIGHVQAFGAETGDASVVMGWTSQVQHHETKVAWSSHGLYLSVADARALAAALIAASDFAETVATEVPIEVAA